MKELFFTGVRHSPNDFERRANWKKGVASAQIRGRGAGFEQNKGVALAVLNHNKDQLRIVSIAIDAQRMQRQNMIEREKNNGKIMEGRERGGACIGDIVVLVFYTALRLCHCKSTLGISCNIF